MEAVASGFVEEEDAGKDLSILGGGLCSVSEGIETSHKSFPDSNYFALSLSTLLLLLSCASDFLPSEG